MYYIYKSRNCFNFVKRTKQSYYPQNPAMIVMNCISEERSKKPEIKPSEQNARESCVKKYREKAEEKCYGHEEN